MTQYEPFQKDREKDRKGSLSNEQPCMDAYWDRVLRHIETYHTGVFMIETESPLTDNYDVHYCYAHSRNEAQKKFLTVYPYYKECILTVAPTQLDPYQIARHLKFIGEDQYITAKQKKDQG